jgi:UDP-N-acetylmuramate--alanine ligase
MSRELMAHVNLRELAARGPIHFVGIAGAGMSALAEMLLSLGAAVSGCDTHPGLVGARLRVRGVTVSDGQDVSHITSSLAAVITTAAIPSDHPELAAARAAKVPVLKRAQALGALVNAGTVVAVAGTHGKTTTTAMTASILAEAGLRPTGFVGGRVPGWDSGLLLGGNELFVVEADEYDRSFLALRPTVALVTTIEADHLDVYGSVEAVQEAFLQFIRLVPSESGVVIACTDDAGARSLLDQVPAALDTVGYGTERAAQFRATNIEVRGRGSLFTVRDRGTELGQMTLPVAGYHNVRNALGATAAALHVGASFESAQRALARFAGVDRRFQELARLHGITVVDDYAHHPTEIRATLSAARAAYPSNRLIAVFQPHLYSRTRDFATDFGAALAGADLVWVTDVYAAREAPLPGVTGELVAQAADRAQARSVQYEPALERINERLLGELRSGDVVVFMGAGSIDGIARELANRLGGVSA